MTLSEIYRAVKAVKNEIWMDATQLGRQPKIYLHWTGGYYDTDFGDYHFCIHGDGTVNQTHDLTGTISATYMRNSGSVAIALDCCADAVAYAGGGCSLGNYPPTSEQVEAVAQVVDVVARALDIPIDLEHVMTHAEAADNADGLEPCDPYGPATTCERWDLAVLKESDPWMSGGDTIRGKAIFYRQTA